MFSTSDDFELTESHKGFPVIPSTINTKVSRHHSPSQSQQDGASQHLAYDEDCINICSNTTRSSWYKKSNNIIRFWNWKQWKDEIQCQYKILI